MPQALPEISVIIPVYNDPRLSQCLDALQRQSIDSTRFEVIVVDNGSAEPPAELVRRMGYHFVQEAKPGSYAARNRGLAEARGEILAFTDADCIPSPQWLDAGVRALQEAGPAGGLVGGPVELFFKDPRRPNWAELYDSVTSLDSQTYVLKQGFCVTANLFTKRIVFEQAGAFNAELMSGGDHEWSRRAIAHGWRLMYEPQATVRHPARASLRELMTKRSRLTGGKLVSARQQGPAARRRVLALAFRPRIRYWRQRANHPKLNSAIARCKVFLLEAWLNAVDAWVATRHLLGGRLERK